MRAPWGQLFRQCCGGWGALSVQEGTVSSSQVNAGDCAQGQEALEWPPLRTTLSGNFGPGNPGSSSGQKTDLLVGLLFVFIFRLLCKMMKGIKIPH